MTPTVALATERTVQVASRIAGVTVYPDRAQVRRVAEVGLARGEHRVVFTRLPNELSADAIRISAEGTVATTLHGFDLKTVSLGTIPHKEVAELEKRLESLGDQDRQLADQRAVHQRHLDTIRETAERAPGGFSGQLAAGKANLATWRDLLVFMEQRQASQAKALQTIDRQRRTLARQMAEVRTELNRLKGFRKQDFQQVEVLLETADAGTVTVSLEYGIGNASWSPAHDARLDAKGHSLDWRSYGVVSQSTGENWNDIELVLSTARPAEGSAPPPIPQWFLNPYAPFPSESYAAPAPSSRLMQRKTAAPGGARAEMADQIAPRRAQEARAVVADQGTSISLEVPRKVTIPSDGQPHQTPIGPVAMKAESEYKVLSKLSPNAFLLVQATHPGPWPLLPGPVKAFVGKDHIGTVSLDEEVPASKRFSLPMGVDRAIEVKRNRLSKQTGITGVLQKRKYAAYRYEIQATNHKSTAQTLRVIDLYPQVSQDDIQVERVGVTPAALSDVPAGQLHWRLPLQPGERRIIQWGYRVEWPQEMELSGVE
ncbi:MAG: mucoidy inhibitor MuiA family protein [Candidatus Sericytochromatia bacterium]|nr:mucoidy inhibitor MuiA family protein [Candidatus Sericytochromatia bacterium]